MTRTNRTIGLVALLAVSAWGRGAQATAERPGLVAPSLPSVERARLAQEVERARRDQPEAFARLRTIGGVRSEVYRKTRARRPEVTRELRRLGASAFWPMLEVMALRGFATEPPLTDEERRALERGLVAVVGELRDRRAAGVLRAVLLAGDPEIEELAALGLGKLCGAPELALLVERSRAGEAHAEAAIAGLGWCRQSASAERLAAIIEEGEVHSARAAVRALGTIGSSWAWQSGSAGDAADGERIRGIAASALVRAGASGLVPVEEVKPSLALLDEGSVVRAVAAERSSLRDRASLERLGQFTRGAR